MKSHKIPGVRKIHLFGSDQKSLKHQKGMSLIEVMVSALITAIGILGYAGMQIQTLGETGNAQHRMQAVALAGDLVSRLRVNADERTKYVNADYSTAPTATECNSAVCTEAQLADADIYAIYQQLQQLLPRATMSIAENAAKGTVMVRIAWNGAPATAAACDNPVLDETNQFESNCAAMEFSR